MSSHGDSAGTTGRRKYDELVRSWRRRHRTAFAVVGVACSCVLLLSFVAAQLWPAAAWGAGLAGGAALAFGVLARISPPGWIENWETGARGEQMTAKVLRELERDGWIVLHDLSVGKGNIDHIVIGVAGVYLLDSKRLDGVVSVDNQGVTVRRVDDLDLSYRHSGSGHIRSLARQTHDRVLTSSRINTWVTPMMVLWADFPQRVVEDDCVYVHGNQLAGWLRARPQTIAPSRVRQIADAVQAAWQLNPEPTRCTRQGPRRHRYVHTDLLLTFR